jgi:very-short-patch-repair endonuclease
VTIVDLAAELGRDEVEQAINEADVKGLARPDNLRRALDDMPRWPGVATLRQILDRRTFRLTRSQLERLFIPVALRAGLPRPLTRVHVNGVEVDFYWPELGLVVETDGLTYHRTPQQQAKDVVRDHRHAVAEIERLRFTHEQIRYDRAYVERILRQVADRLRRSAPR